MHEQLLRTLRVVRILRVLRRSTSPPIPLSLARSLPPSLSLSLSLTRSLARSLAPSPPLPPSLPPSRSLSTVPIPFTPLLRLPSPLLLIFPRSRPPAPLSLSTPLALDSSPSPTTPPTRSVHERSESSSRYPVHVGGGSSRRLGGLGVVSGPLADRVTERGCDIEGIGDGQSGTTTRT